MMRKFLHLSVTCLLAVPLWSQGIALGVFGHNYSGAITPSVVQAQSFEQSVNQTTVQVSISTTAGNLLVAFVRSATVTSQSASVSDSASQSWTAVSAGKSTSSTTLFGQMFYMASSAAVTTVKATFAQANLNNSIVVFEIGGAAASSPEDSSVNSNATSNVLTLASGALTTTNANDILLYAIAGNSTLGAATAGTGYAIPTNGESSGTRIAMQYKVVSTTQSAVTTSMSWVTQRSAVSTFAAFK
jgi:hypothetical protein